MNSAVIPKRSGRVTRDEMCMVVCLQCHAVAGMRELGCFDILFENGFPKICTLHILCNFVIDLLLRGCFHVSPTRVFVS